VCNHVDDLPDRIINKVFKCMDSSDRVQGFMAALVSGIPLHGEVLAARWKAQALMYPLDLAKKILREHAPIDSFSDLAMFHARQNNILIHTTLVNIIEQLYRVLLAINHQYYPGIKWINMIVQQLPLAPANFGDRLESVFSSNAHESTRIITCLVYETYDLLERHMPQLDIDSLRRRFINQEEQSKRAAGL
jgi:hypothetical protein